MHCAFCSDISAGFASDRALRQSPMASADAAPSEEESAPLTSFLRRLVTAGKGTEIGIARESATASVPKLLSPNECVKFGLLKALHNRTKCDLRALILFSWRTQDANYQVLIPKIRAGEDFVRPIYIPIQAHIGVCEEGIVTPLYNYSDVESESGASVFSGRDPPNIENIIDCGKMRQSMTLYLEAK